MTKKVAVISTHPIQYQAPIWRLLANDPNLDIHVYYGSDCSVRGYRDAGFGVLVRWDVPLTEGYKYTFLSTEEVAGENGGFFKMRAHNLKNHLLEFQPDAVLINAYMPFFWWEALVTARLLKIPVIIRAETTDESHSRTVIKQFLRNTFLRLFYSQCDSFLAIGQNSRAHYERLGIPANQIGWSPYCVNSKMLDIQIENYAPLRSVIRQEMGFTDEQIVFIFSGKLFDRKDPLTLARALQTILETERGEIGLIVLGDGELRQPFQSACQAALGNRAYFAGFVNQKSNWTVLCSC